MTTDDLHRMRLFENEITRLDQLYEHLERLWAAVPRYWYVGLLAPVVWYFAGLGWAIAHLLVTASLVGTQAYLIRTRQSENRWSRQQIAEDLERLRAELDGSSQQD